MNKYNTTAQIREAFLSFFEEHQHQRVPSSSLIPGNDPTLLFTNAGMVQFKDVFLGQDKRNYQRATSSQRCVRAGGKHNDLENVGYTARHHTFFEMLGNFSFGDYFKREAIQFAWTFLTEVLGLPEERLWVTVHISDDEAESIWLNDMGVSKERFSKLDEDNFWQMGDTGPCGPSSEIFYDHGADVAGDPPGGPNDDGDRYIEIWNLVFMQYERHADGRLEPLPNPSIDTGMGLERIAAVMQGVHNNYEIDLFMHLLKAASKLTDCDDLSNQSLRVIADHIRSCAFLVVDGVVPGSEGRAYVLRRIVRRAIRHGYKLGAVENFFHQLVPALVEVMGEAYPELLEKQQQVSQVLLAEERQFAKTLTQGMSLLDEEMAKLEKSNSKEIPGEVVFKLYDSHGFPVDLCNDVAREKGYTLDLDGYEKCMAEQRARSQASSNFAIDYTDQLSLDGETLFCGYESVKAESEISYLISDGEIIDMIEASEQAVGVVLKETPFYAESGGQIGDHGVLLAPNVEFEVVNTTKSGDQYVHWGVLKSGNLAVGDTLEAIIDDQKRIATARNHSATHLLHAALRDVLGEHVEQKGSLVDSQRLRFDFSHFQAMSNEEIHQVEQLVNHHILNNLSVEITQTSMDQAKAMGAMALFGEKYGDDVRVLSMASGFSVELCGGTHVSRLGDIGLMLIESESGVASGVRRIEAITGELAYQRMNQWRSDLNQLSAIMKASHDTVIDKVAQLQQNSKDKDRQLDELKKQQAAQAGANLANEAKLIGEVKVLVTQLEGIDRKELLNTMDELKSKLEKAIIFIASAQGNGSVSLLAGVTSSLTKQFKAGDLMKYVTQQLDGKGGGRPDMAQGACPQGDKKDLDSALSSVYTWVENTT